MHYLSSCNKGHLKVDIAMFYFCYSKDPLNIMKNIFKSISLYSWKKKFLVNEYGKQMCSSKINLYFFDFMKKFSFKSLSFSMIADFILVEKWRTLERRGGESILTLKGPRSIFKLSLVSRLSLRGQEILKISNSRTLENGPICQILLCF